ncbi:glycoside hydrolase family 5 protein [Ramaria rubella]|nr:glycoside hydrolase family 5 protein [Ramaria rubella]
MEYTFRSATVLALVCVAFAQSPQYGQCGGIGWTGATTCVSGNVCTVINDYYWQCLAGTATTTVSSGGSGGAAPTSSASSPVASPTPTPPSSGAGKVKFAGINIAGFDFGCGSDGTCNVSGAYPPLTQTYGPDGPGQMQHFVKDDGFNMFRLPVSWQYLVNGVLGGPLYNGTFSIYDTLVQDCLATGAYCIIDIHNYARWNGEIIGQGGPTNAQFADVWSQLATYYKDEDRIVFGTMNEPHDIPDITIWAATVQAVVTAIRNAGATTQMILLPGNNWTSAQTYVSDGSADALGAVTNPDGTIDNLIMEVHKYSDSDNSGTSSVCVTNNIDDAFAPLATYAREKGRLVLNTEFGGGPGSDCVTFIGQQLAYLNENNDVYLGWTAWAAGSFVAGYPLDLSPVETNGVWTDTPLAAQALVPAFQ